MNQLSQHSESLKQPADRSAFDALTTPLSDTVLTYSKCKAAGVPGSERVLQSFLEILRNWIAAERWFCDGRSYADAVDSLRKAHKTESQAVLDACKAHEQLGTTTEVVMRILDALADGSRIDFENTSAPAIGKRVSIVAGAGGLHSVIPSVSEIGSMGSVDAYAEVALRARKIVMQESMPSLEQRRQCVRNASIALSASQQAGPVREVEELLADHIPMADVFFSLLKSAQSPEEEVGMVELHIRHLYRPYAIKRLDRDPEHRSIQFTFMNKPSESLINASTSLVSMNDLTKMMSSGSLVGLVSDASEHSSDSGLFNKEKIPQAATRSGVGVIVGSLDELNDPSKMEDVLSRFPQYSGAAKSCPVPVNALYLFVMGNLVGLSESSQDEIASQCHSLLAPYKSKLEKADVRRVSFVFDREKEDDLHNFAAIFTFRYPDFKEDGLFRQIDPSLAVHLDLNRVSANFYIRSVGSTQETTSYAHLYECSPRPTALAKDSQANKAPRIFVRSLCFVLEFSTSSFERVVVDALNALDLCTIKSKSDNHLFLNLVGDFEKAVLDPVVVEQVVVEILKRHGDRVSALGIVEVETRIVCCLSVNTPPIAIRLFASNPTGFVPVMNTYVEAADEKGSERVFKLISGTKASLASAGDSSWDGVNVNTPYPLTRPFDAQRKGALRASDTLYCYDLPALFEAAVEQQWVEASEKGGVEGNVRVAARPLMVMYTTELVVKRKGGEITDRWTMKDYLDGALELAQINRGAGANDVGMVAWLIVLKTVEYPNVSVDVVACLVCGRF
jgi:acetyl-CoA carboxylase/biotin carboxylase 1